MNVVRLWRLLFASALMALAVPSTWSARLGDPASPLSVKAWVKGGPVDVRDGKHIYVVEFWATWCPPCRTSIPLLTEIERKYRDKGVVIVGISNEELEQVKPFVQQMGTNMEYRVAIDNETKSNQDYMAAFGQVYIPTAFIVGKEGKVIWVGSPLMGLDLALEEIVTGKYDLKLALQRDAWRSVIQEYQQLAAGGNPKARELGRKLLTEAAKDAQTLCNFALGIWTDTQTTNRDLALADEAVDKAATLAGGRDRRVWGARLQKYSFLTGRADPKAAELGRLLIADAGEDVQGLCSLAFETVKYLQVTNRNFALAEEALNQAEKLVKGRDHRMVSLRGLTRFEAGKQDEGFALVREALALAPDDQARMNYQNFLRVMEMRRSEQAQAQQRAQAQPQTQNPGPLGPPAPPPQPKPPPQAQGVPGKS
jgi:thiol-disulfide isomerase/thioredoxin